MESFSEYLFMVMRDRYGSFCQPLGLRPGTRVQTQHFAVAQCVFHFGACCLEQTHVAQICSLRSNRNTECCCSPVLMCTKLDQALATLKYV